MSPPRPAAPTQAASGKARQIAVIGGGAKAAALAARANILQEQGQGHVHVTIFEPIRIGAYWSGQSGYTDGEQRLCTMVERDVGYPYHAMSGYDTDVALSTRFSWMRFLHTRPAGYEGGYSTWVDAGRKPPAHKHYADYLQWVVAQAAPHASIVKQEVRGLVKHGKRWHIAVQDASANLSTHVTGFDAVVVTGPGPARRIPVTGIATGVHHVASLFDGRDFWQRLEGVRTCVQQIRADHDFSSNGIVIIGAGGTAAAILAWLVAHGAGDLQIHMVANQASLYTRVDSVFENQLFSDESQWAALSPASRRAFFDRVNRGVVWSTVMERVASARKFTMVDGRATHIGAADPTQLAVSVVRDGVEFTLPASMVVDCSGFDPWWFLPMIDGLQDVAQRSARHRDQRRVQMGRDRWQKRMNADFSLQGLPWNHYPPLHAPMLSSALGPGFGSLMVLGAMAERILRRYGAW